MKVPYSWLQSKFNQALSDVATLEKLFTFRVFEVESVEQVEGESVFDLKTLADRNHYALSLVGIAREVSAFTGLPFTHTSHKPREGEDGVSTPKVTIEATDFCSRFVCRVVEGADMVQKDPETEHLLRLVGVRVISPIVDATNRVMLELGQPLHAFDADKLVGNITIRKARAGEKLVLLGGKEITLTAEDHVVADEQGPLDLAGIKGGARAEVDAQTKRIFCMAACFNGVLVRRAGVRHGIRTDASKRYENVVRDELTLEAMHELTGCLGRCLKSPRFGHIQDTQVSVFTSVERPTFRVTCAYISARLGFEVTEKEFQTQMDRLGVKVEVVGVGEYTVTAPAWRLDLVRKEDIVEEVGRLLGYDRVGLTVPTIATPPIYSDEFLLAESVKTSLIRKGFTEVMLYSLVNRGYFETAYPIAADKSCLREELSAGLVSALVKNTRNADLVGLDEVKLFEVGTVFPESGEKTHLALAFGIPKKRKGFDVQKVLEAVLADLTREAKIACTMVSFTPVAEVYGGVIEVRCELRDTTVSIDALEFARLPQGAFKQYSEYPFAVRDVAFFARERQDTSELASLLMKVAGEHCARVRLFDSFEKAGEDGQVKYSYGFRLVFQAVDHTLTEEEIIKPVEAVYQVLTQRGFQIR